jgi:branched-chain amino acid transport system substrate-binding protein
MDSKAHKMIALIGMGVALASVAACGSSANGSSGTGAAGSSPPASSGGTLSILAIEALSGPLSTVGQEQVYGLKAAVAAVNAAGGVNGKPITLTIKDDAGSATQAVSVLEQALSSGSKPDVVNAGSTSTETVAMAPVLTKDKVFTVTNSATTALADSSTYPYLFGTVETAAESSDALADKLITEGFKKVAVISSDDDLGQSGSSSMASALQAHGVSVSVQLVPDTAVDATSQLESLEASHPAALVIDNFGPTAAAVLKARSELGWNVPAYATQDFTANNLSQIATPAELKGITLESLAYLVIGNPTQETAAFKTFYKDVTALNSGTFLYSINIPINTWDNVILAAAAANKAHSTNAAAMRAAAESLTSADVPLFIGPSPLGYSVSNHYPVFGPGIWAFVPAGPTVHGQIQPGS